MIVSGSNDETVRIWDAATGALIGQPADRSHRRGQAVAFGWVGGRAVIISGGGRRTVRIWDAATGAPVGHR